MCFELDSSPPIHKIKGAAVNFQDVTLTSSDATQFATFYAESNSPKGPGIVILPDVRGLYRFYEELALRFAEHGYDAIAIDYFGRTAGISKRDDDFAFMEHVAQTKVAQVTSDVTAAINHLKNRDSYENRSIFTLGLCFGGSSAWVQAAGQEELSGAIGFYGHPTRENRDQTPGPIHLVENFKCSILALMGGADQGIPVDEINKFEDALNKAKIKNEIVIYDGAPHSFFDRKFEEFQSESDDSWNRVLSFIDQNA